MRELDQLWLKHSNNRFGFSQQARVWREVGRLSAVSTAAWDRFGDQVGWRQGGRWLNYAALEPSIASPAGMLPYLGQWFGRLITNLNVQGIESYLTALYGRVEVCGL